MDIIKNSKAKFPDSARSVAIFSIGDKVNPSGLITVFSNVENIFDEEEVNLMTEIVNDITFAFSTIEKAFEKRLADEELRFSKRAAESLYSLSQKTNLLRKSLLI